MLDNIVIRLNEGKLLYSVDGNNTLYTLNVCFVKCFREMLYTWNSSSRWKTTFVCLYIVQRCLTFCLGKSGIPGKFSSNYTCV